MILNAVKSGKATDDVKKVHVLVFCSYAFASGFPILNIDQDINLKLKSLPLVLSLVIVQACSYLVSAVLLFIL